MRFLRLNRRARTDDAPIAAPDHAPLDLDRLDRLIETGGRVHELGIDYETIALRAAADGVSWNEALETIDKERTDA